MKHENQSVQFNDESSNDTNKDSCDERIQLIDENRIEGEEDTNLKEFDFEVTLQEKKNTLDNFNSKNDIKQIKQGR